MTPADETLLGQVFILYPLFGYMAVLALYWAVKNRSLVIRAFRLIPLAFIDLSLLALTAAKRRI